MRRTTRLAQMVGGALVALVIAAPTVGAEPPGSDHKVRDGQPATTEPGGGSASEGAGPEGGPGTLDNTFSADGLVTVNATPGLDAANDVVVQPDGAVVAAGISGGYGRRFGLVRRTATGARDTTFGGGDGAVQTNFSPRTDFADDVALAPDNDIVAVGTADFERNANIAIARYQPDGTLDPTFSGDGKLIIDLGTSFDQAWGVRVQPDGKIVVAANKSLAAAFVILRLNPDGSFDPTFSGDGVNTTQFPRRLDLVYGMDLGDDGDIVVVGETADLNRQGLLVNEALAIARYNPDGTLDTTFSGDGKFMEVGGSRVQWGTSAELLADGTTVVSGGNNASFQAARITPGGVLDTSFSGDGRAVVPFGAGADTAWDVGVQADGKVVLGGVDDAPNQRFALARLNANGTLDPTFDGDGKAASDVTPTDDGIGGLVVVPESLPLAGDGTIVVAGYAADASRFGLARYLAG